MSVIDLKLKEGCQTDLIQRKKEIPKLGEDKDFKDSIIVNKKGPGVRHEGINL